MTESQLSESLSDRLTALKSPLPDGLIARVRTAADAPAPHGTRNLTPSLANFDPPVNSPRRRGLNLIAGLAGFAVVAAGLGVFALDVSGRLHSPVAAPAAKGARHKSTPGAPWVVQEFHGDGLVVTLDHPAPWHSQLQPLSIHYAAVFGYLANYPLQPFCTHPSATSFECSWANVGKIPLDGVVVSFGTSGYGPGPGVKAQLLSQGTPTTIDGRRASERSGSGSVCGGSGADHALTLWIDDGKAAGVFDISFCWHGSDPSLAEAVNKVATTLTLRPDPTNAGPFPS